MYKKQIEEIVKTKEDISEKIDAMEKEYVEKIE
jgi:hypothetical protein